MLKTWCSCSSWTFLWMLIKKKEKRMTQKAFIRSQIGYCSLVWIFHSWGLNNKTNWIHERASRISYKDKSLSFQNLLKEDNSATIHHSNIKILATETYKFLQGLSPSLMKEIFVERNNNYSLWGNNVLSRWRINSVRYRTDTVSFLAPKIWDNLPKDIKDSESLNIFKGKIKSNFMVMPLQTLYLSRKNQRYILSTKLNSISFSIIVKMLVYHHDMYWYW